MHSSNDSAWCTCDADGLARAMRRTVSGEPDAGNPPVRFDEGGLSAPLRGTLSPLLYRFLLGSPRMLVLFDLFSSAL